MTLLFDLALVAWLIALAGHIAMTREDRNAIVAFIAFGLLLGLAWVRLSALDVALTEVAIGGGVTGVLLLSAEAHLRKPLAQDSAQDRPHDGRRRLGNVGTIAAALASAAVTAGLALAVLALPTPAPTLAPVAAAALDTTGLGNPVTAVLLAYRALDTLLEKVVLLLALVGVWSLAPDRTWGGAPSLAPAVAPEPLVYLARVLPPFGVVIAVYMFWVGADAPGGTFQAGTVLAAMWLIVMLAGLRQPPDTAHRVLRLLLVGGPALFLAVGFLGFFIADGFLAYPEPIAKPLILGIEAALTLSIAATLAMLVAGPAQKAPEP
ncbi:hydrogenase subunit MbhD domain-containing protein [Chelatococcus asaccharovorans]|uniref:hydrogenase subunit MbhD domain-containing protein n=1 Tax=Chelatococcus asaccharovorans TaxID=28210 RepID=UPI00224C7BAC|nr:hydrogenase subunit MbhD domain-containing protein [Chelatococcus asaccharovorans]CAH1659172.1 Multisubunit sodium/proton antiporter MrpB subunit [Chelatococcus asaccharovorans]CAH1688123.1 Multisubunit sodium/proton antiporter MrpB subunit [Chelatococcus asaccharovorans]